MTVVPARPDALMCTKESLLRLAAGYDRARATDRVDVASKAAAAVLGDKAQIRIQPGGMLFITRSGHPYDSIFFHRGHPQEGASRYRWERQPDGSMWGWYVPGAEECLATVIT